MNLRAACLITLAGLLTACGAPAPLVPPDPEPAVQPTPPPPRETTPVAGPQGRLIPIDRWRRDLDQLLPPPWRYHHLEGQVAAPPGYTRTGGDRGVGIWLTDGTAWQAFTVMPADFDGTVVDLSGLARVVAKDERFVLYAPPKSAAGWSATPQVIAALGIGAVDPQEAELRRDRAAARGGMAQLAEAVARFRADVGYLPIRLDDLWTSPPDAEAWKGPYATETEAYDPWGSHFAYAATAEGFTLRTFGADGLRGGEGPDSDLEHTPALQK